MYRWQAIEAALTQQIKTADGEPKGHPALWAGFRNIIKDSIPDLTGSELAEALNSMWLSKRLQIRIWDRAWERFRDYRGNTLDQMRNQLWLKV